MYLNIGNVFGTIRLAASQCSNVMLVASRHQGRDSWSNAAHSRDIVTMRINTSGSSGAVKFTAGFRGGSRELG